jgi:hypothetical protein
MRIARVAGTYFGKIIFSMLLLQSAQPVRRKKRAERRRSKFNERMPVLGRALTNERKIFPHARPQSRIPFISLVGNPIDRNLPVPTAVVLTLWAEAVEALGVLWTKML